MFRNELREIKNGLIKISRLVSLAITKSTDSLFTNNLELAEKIIKEDFEIDRQQIILDEHAIDIIACQAPVASDLRILVATLRVSASLERMGDLARHISQLVLLRHPQAVIPISMRPIFIQMADKDKIISILLEELIETRDLSIVEKIITLKNDINKLHSSVFQKLTNKKGEIYEPQEIIDLALLSRYFERFSDHSISISAKISYFETGEWDSNYET